MKFYEGIDEMRIHYGPGYRVYFVRYGTALVILLCGRHKGSQKRDMKTALAMAKGIET